MQTHQRSHPADGTQISDIHRKYGDHKYVEGKAPYTQVHHAAGYNPGLPVVAFRLNDTFKKNYPHVKQASVSFNEVFNSLQLTDN